MARSTDITSSTELRQHLRERLQQVQETGRPLFVTTNGHKDAVVMSAATYDALAEKAALAESLVVIDRSMEDVRANRGDDFKSAIEGIADQLGLPLE